MRFLSIDLLNYVGIANGLGRHHIHIDFSRCKNRIVIIKGDNGSGKSTIFKALQILPDPSSMFIPGMDARKIIEVYDEVTGTTYMAQYEHTSKPDKGYTTKGYFYKTVNGTTVNMNEHGNISTCKDIIYSELNLDANFISLSQLSFEDKGLASKSPAERKQFVANILQTLEVYNSIHKTISKRTSNFKSMINATMNKIEKLGDENLIISSLDSVTNRLFAATQDRDRCVQELGSLKGVISSLDPNGSLQETYKNLSEDIRKLVADKVILESKIEETKKSVNISGANEELYESTKEKRIAMQSEVASIESTITKLLSDRNNETQELQRKIARFNAINSESNYEDTKKLIASYEAKLTEYTEFFKEIGLRDYSLTRDEYIIGLNTLKDIKDTVDNFKGVFDYAVLQDTLANYIPTMQYPDKSVIDDEISNLESYIVECKQKIVYYNGVLSVASKLNDRHKDCHIDDCNFIKDAVLAAKEEPEKNLTLLEDEISGTETILSQKYKDRDHIVAIINCMNYFKVLYRNIDGYSSILKKLPNGDIFSDKEKFTSLLLKGSTFEEINEIYPYITKASIVEDYNRTSKDLDKLYADAKLFESKESIIQEIKCDIASLSEKVDFLTNRIAEESENANKLKSDIYQYSHTEDALKTLLNLYGMLDRIKSDISEKSESMKNIENSMSVISQNLQQIENVRRHISSIGDTLSSLESERSKLEHNLKLLVEYKEEVEAYSNTYEKMNTIKFYSSYNTGIQTVYMLLYMNKVNQIANRLMQYVLGGRFHLLQWSINETEFRIPCLGEGGYLNNDISSLSGGEMAIVSTIISLSLLYQASTKFNIPKLDEVDATLDTTNRRTFIAAYEQLLDILNASQSIMISHNNELSLDNADIIILRMEDVSKYNETRSTGNVIFDIREE